MKPFYKEINALNRDLNKNLKLVQSNDSDFAKNMHLIPLAWLEFFQAARHYPIVFIGEGNDIVPIALLGLQPETNLFVNEQKQWEDNTYIPAFVRRYPFVLAETDNENSTVCFDAAYAGWNEKEGRALFDGAGKNSEFLDGMIEFLQNFSSEMKRTRLFVEKLNELDLLHNRSIQLTHKNGETFVLTDFITVDEEKFLRLTDEKILDLHKQGCLGIIYAHLMSQGNINQLFSRYMAAKSAHTQTEENTDAVEKAKNKMAAPAVNEITGKNKTKK